ncbi:MAG: hypothetical protein LBB80_10905 [Treponema sp.]|nr:hypothetical protein [Treponema sp.]
MKNINELLGDLLNNAKNFLFTTIESVIEDKELSYEDVMKYFLEHQGDDARIAKGAMIRANDEKGYVILTQVFLDEKNELVCGTDGAPLGRKITVPKLDAELVKLFKNNNLVVVS